MLQEDKENGMQNVKDISLEKFLIKLLKLQYITKPLYSTNKGDLGILVRAGEDSYVFTLDSVPVSKEIDEEIKKRFVFN